MCASSRNNGGEDEYGRRQTRAPPWITVAHTLQPGDIACVSASGRAGIAHAPFPGPTTDAAPTPASKRGLRNIWAPGNRKIRAATKHLTFAKPLWHARALACVSACTL